MVSHLLFEELRQIMLFQFVTWALKQYVLTAESSKNEEKKGKKNYEKSVILRKLWVTNIYIQCITYYYLLWRIITDWLTLDTISLTRERSG